MTKPNQDSSQQLDNGHETVHWAQWELVPKFQAGHSLKPQIPKDHLFPGDSACGTWTKCQEVY